MKKWLSPVLAFIWSVALPVYLLVCLHKLNCSFAYNDVKCTVLTGHHSVAILFEWKQSALWLEHNQAEPLLGGVGTWTWLLPSVDANLISAPCGYSANLQIPLQRTCRFIRGRYFLQILIFICRKLKQCGLNLIDAVFFFLFICSFCSALILKLSLKKCAPKKLWDFINIFVKLFAILSIKNILIKFRKISLFIFYIHFLIKTIFPLSND